MSRLRHPQSLISRYPQPRVAGVRSRLRAESWIPRAVAAATLLLILLGGGCSEEKECPACPAAGIVIDRIYALPDTATIGARVQLWALADGADLQYRWNASAGRFLETDSYYALWKAPAEASVAEITVVAYNADESASRVREIVVGAYRPRHEPAYAGAGYCGLQCHDVAGHGSNYATWIEGPHGAAYERVHGSPAAADWCGECHAVGYGDVDSVGWDRHNGGFDEVPVASLEGVQCESCHGPLVDRAGEILADHGDRAYARFLLELGSPDDPVGCGRCHENYAAYLPHTSSHAYLSEWQASGHAVSTADPATHDDGCAECHTAQAFLATQGEWPAEALADPLPVVCATCHDPHGSEHPAALRVGYRSASGDICRLCHSDAAQGYPDAPHAPQAQLFAGQGGYEYPGTVYESSLHENVAQTGCVTCHLGQAPGGEGHTFAADPASCTACHPAATGGSFDWSEGMVTIAGLLDALRAELDRATPEDQQTDAYARALFNWSLVDADGSRGAHNFRYARDLLEASLADFEPSGER